MNYSLTELDAKFLSSSSDGKVRTVVPELKDAHGIRFLCPVCFQRNKGPKGTHVVVCWFEGRVPDSAEPGSGRWNPVGSGLNDLTFVPGRKSNSVMLIGGCAAHFFVDNGRTRP